MESVNLTEALQNHYNPTLALEKLAETHKWLSRSNPPLTDEQLAERGWKKAYNLTVWDEMPGEVDMTSNNPMLGMLFGMLTGGRYGKPVGPGASFRNEVGQLRKALE